MQMRAVMFGGEAEPNWRPGGERVCWCGSQISFLGLVWTGRDETERLKWQTSSRGHLGDSGHSCDVGLLCNRLWHWELILHCRRPLWGVPSALGDCQCVSLGRWTAVPSERQTPTLWSVFPGFVFLSPSQRWAHAQVCSEHCMPWQETPVQQCHLTPAGVSLMRCNVTTTRGILPEIKTSTRREGERT